MKRHACSLLLSLMSLPAGAQAVAEALPLWNYSMIGEETGRAGIFALQTGNGREIFCESHPGSSLWLAMRHDPVAGDYRIAHASFPASSYQMAGFHPAQVSGDPTPELIAGHEDGTIMIYDATSRELISQFRPLGEMRGFLPYDLNGDGNIEFVCLTIDQMIVIDLNGLEMWRVYGAGGERLVVGQMDGDPALEIATSFGKVVDSGTRAIQWAPQGGFGAYLAAHDFDNDGMAELLGAGAGYEVRAYDVDIETTKWSYRTAGSADGFLLASVDADPEPELIHSDQDGLEALDLSATGTSSKWKITNPDHTTEGLALDDLDGDGNLELVWSTRNAGSLSGKLRVIGIPTLLEEWSSKPLERPFVGMCKGDVSGDGIPEYVFASAKSKSKSGQIQVLDVNTLSLMGVSGPVFGWLGSAEIVDLCLCDVDGDGRFEIAVSGQETGGLLAAKIYRFDPQKGFQEIWETPRNFSNHSAARIEVADVDADGDLEVVIAALRQQFGGQNLLFVFDYDSGTEQWRSPAMPTAWGGPLTLSVSDVDADGRIEAVMGCAGAGFEVYDLELEMIERSVSLPKLTCVASRQGQPGIEVGTTDGMLVRYMVDGAGSYVSNGATTFSPERIEQIIPTFGDSLFTIGGNRIRLHQPDGSVTWQTALLPGQLSKRLSPLSTLDGWELFTNLTFGGSIFPLDSVDDETVVDVFASGLLREGGTAGGTFAVTRHRAAEEALPVRFTLSGVATSGTDFQVVGATDEGNGSWQTEIPAGATAAVVGVTIVNDSLAEGDETIDFLVGGGVGYVAGPDRAASLRIADNESSVGVYVTSPRISEETSVKNGEGAEILFHRNVDISRSLKVPFSISGSATPGVDCTKLKNSVNFKAGSDRVSIKVIAGFDGKVESDESLVITLSPATTHAAKNGAESALLTIEDLSNSVQLAEAVRSNKGIQIIAHRSHPLDQAQSVSVVERRIYADGSSREYRRRVVFPKGRYEGVLSIPGDKRDVRIEWRLISDGTFLPGGVETLVYDWSSDS